jgi:8-oxo-dGTP pyrophosphatase MutT (NUDIX family)
MPISPYLRELRRQVGHALLVMPSVAALVRDPGGRVLVQRRADSGAWELPGGAVDPGEAPAQALVREVFEETGLVVRPRRLLAVLGGPEHRLHYPNGDVTEYTAAIFGCEPVRGTLGPRDGEATEVRFVADDEAARLLSPALAPLLAGAPFQWHEAWLEVDA